MKKLMFAAPALAMAAVAGLSLPAAHAEGNVSWSHVGSLAAPQQVLDGTDGTYGARVLTYELHPDMIPNQLWRMEDRADGTVAIVNKTDGMCLASTGSHSAVQLEACDTMALDQRWYENTRADIRVYESADVLGQCLTNDGPDAVAVISECNQSPAQAWRLLA